MSDASTTEPTAATEAEATVLSATASKTEVRKVLGRGKFATAEFAAAAGVTAPTARKRITALVEAGVIEALPETRKNLDAEGNALRGRPAALFRVGSGK
jgi:predicted ArsR family transcriptional regulator